MEFPIPEAQYWDVSKKSQKDRQMIRKFVPEAVDLATISRAEIYRIDTFYLECQKYRDHYRDPITHQSSGGDVFLSSYE